MDIHISRIHVLRAAVSASLYNQDIPYPRQLIQKAFCLVLLTLVGVFLDGLIAGSASSP